MSLKDQTSNDGPARGLIQITESTRKILQDLNGEIKNHHIELGQIELHSITESYQIERYFYKSLPYL